MTQFLTIDIVVTGIADDAFPIWLNFELMDRHGVRHFFEEKVPVILSENDALRESFPQKIQLKCSLIETYDDYVVISTAELYNIISNAGKGEFEVPLSAIHKGPNA